MGHQTSAIGHRKLDIRHQTSETDVRHQTLDIRHKTSDIELRTSDIGHRTSDIRHQTSDIRREISYIGHQTSNIGHQTSDIRYQPLARSLIWLWKEWLLFLMDLLITNDQLVLFEKILTNPFSAVQWELSWTDTLGKLGREKGVGNWRWRFTRITIMALASGH